MHLPERFTPLWRPPPGAAAAARWFLFRGGSLLVRTSGSRLDVPEVAAGEAPPLPGEEIRCIGTWGETPCFAAQAGPGELPDGLTLAPLRALFDQLPDALLAIAGRAAQILDFDRTHRHCGVCAAPTELGDDGRARRCTRCEATSYPRIAPAMMALVTRTGPAGRELLLARGTRFNVPIYSALAGFVEPSESLEECVHREVREEVGVAVEHLRYFGSQCWPFPHSLMVAFLAEHAGGEIACDPGEIVDAQWFPVDRLPMLPHRLSVARKLIDFAVSEARGGAAPGLRGEAALRP
jgi:NAD+ diphosphatase